MFSVNSSAAVMVDGKIVAAVSEDRFSRRKGVNTYPKQSIDFCLKHANVDPSQIDFVALPYLGITGPRDFDKLIVDYDNTFSIKEKIEEQHKYFKPLLLEGKQVEFLEVFKHKIIPERYEYYLKDPDHNPIHMYLKNHLGIEKNRIKYYRHNLSHVYYGIYSQKIKRNPALILTMEGYGGDASASIYKYENGRISLLYKTDQGLIGRLYRYMTLLLGMKTNEHEFKVMGLAPYANQYHIQEPLNVFRDILYVDGIELKFKNKPNDLYFHFREKFEGVRFDAIAGAVQQYTEEIMTQWTANAIKETGIRDVIWSGGVALNIKAMMEISKIPELKSLWVGATSNDESLPMGALFQAYHMEYQKEPVLLDTVYLGNSYSKGDVEKFLSTISAPENFTIIKNISDDAIADILVDQNVIGRFSGRMEFGQRSLGNRSILANPKDPKMIRKINEKIKSRDFWMPFAPVILKERQHDYLINPKNIDSPFMTIGFETTELAQKDLPAALHPYDFTARPQILDPADNPGYYSIIKAFERKTGVGCLLNTSFNLHGEPIVCTLDDAWSTFIRSGLDAIILEHVLVTKK
jgi:carbamoyltransferase